MENWTSDQLLTYLRFSDCDKLCEGNTGKSMKIEAFAELPPNKVTLHILFSLRKLLEVSRLMAPSKIRPVEGGEAGEARAPPGNFQI